MSLSLLRRVRRRFLPAHVRADIRDQGLLRARLVETLRPDSACLDVGAHAGVVLQEMVRLAPRGSHVAWEPLPEYAARLRERFPSVDVREAALSDHTGESEFVRVVGDPAWSGFRERETPSGSEVEGLTVRCERLDDVLPADCSPALLKIDVEGAEEQVLRGATETLRRHHPVIAFEHGLGAADEYGTTPGAIHDLLTALGYEIRGLDLDGPYSRERFAEIFAANERFNFLAVP